MLTRRNSKVAGEEEPGISDRKQPPAPHISSALEELNLGSNSKLPFLVANKKNCHFLSVNSVRRAIAVQNLETV